MIPVVETGHAPSLHRLLILFNLIYPKKEINTPAATAEPITPDILLAMQYCKTWFFGSYCNAISFATREAIGTALKPVAPISGLIFFLVNKLKILTKKIPPAIDKANAKKPPITIPIVVRFKNASVVMVAPTDNPRKIVAAFMMLLEAASNRRNVLVPISFTRLPNINIPIKGTELGTNRATTVVTTIGKII